MCQHCFIIVGCRNFQKRARTPAGYPAPPNNVYCPTCSAVTDAVYYRNHKYCHCCFIPCCPCGESDPYLVCKKCTEVLGKAEVFRCNSCGVATLFESKNCPNCGAEKESAPGNDYRRLDRG